MNVTPHVEAACGRRDIPIVCVIKSPMAVMVVLEMCMIRTGPLRSSMLSADMIVSALGDLSAIIGGEEGSE